MVPGVFEILGRSELVIILVVDNFDLLGFGCILEGAVIFLLRGMFLGKIRGPLIVFSGMIIGLHYNC